MVHLRQLRLLLHRTRQGLAPRQLRLLHGQRARRTPQIPESMLPQVVRPGDTLEEWLVEREVLVQDMPSPTVAEDARGDQRMVDVAQQRSMEGGIDPEATVGQQWRRRMAVQLERIPTRQLVGRQPERLAMTPWLASLNMAL